MKAVDVLLGLLALLTALHFEHAVSATFWMYAHGAEWGALVPPTHDDDARARCIAYRDTGAWQLPWLFFGVKSTRLLWWQLNLAPRAVALFPRAARFLWRWNRYAPLTSAIVVWASFANKTWPQWIRLSLWITALLLTVGTLVIVMEGVIARFHVGFWADRHHGWRRPSVSPYVMDLAMWVGSIIISAIAASSLMSAAALQLQGFTGFPQDGAFGDQVINLAGLSVPFLLPFHGEILNAFGAISMAAVNLLYFANIAVLLAVLLVDPEKGPHRPPSTG